MKTQKKLKKASASFITITSIVAVSAMIASQDIRCDTETKSIVGQNAPPIQITEWITPNPPSQTDLQGKVYVLEFWATWCSPCIRSIPHMIELANKHKDVTFISVSTDNSSNPVKNMVQSKSINYNVAMDNGLARKYFVRGIPEAFIIDRNGYIAWQGHPMNPQFESNIEKTLTDTPTQTLE